MAMLPIYILLLHTRQPVAEYAHAMSFCRQPSRCNCSFLQPPCSGQGQCRHDEQRIMPLLEACHDNTSWAWIQLSTTTSGEQAALNILESKSNVGPA